MKTLKKIIISVLIFLITYNSILPINSFAATDNELEQKQRQALVKIASEIVKTGNTKSILRYSQAHRNTGFNWQVVTDGTTRQSTVTTINLLDSDLAEIEIILKRATGREIKAKQTAYKCVVYGDYIKGTIPFDCSSFCSAIYKFALKNESGEALTLSNGGNAYTTETFKSDSSDYFDKISVKSAKPGDILWKEGHVALYLGDTNGDGIDEVAEALGMIDGSAGHFNSRDPYVRAQLLAFFRANPKYIKEHPDYNELNPDLKKYRVFNTNQNGNGAVKNNILDARKQVKISNINLSAGRFTTAYRLKPSVAKEYTNINTLVEWPYGEREDFWTSEIDAKLDDQELVLSEGFFHKGAPTYGQYVGRITELDWLINKIQDMFDWMVGVIFTGFKVQIIGWTSVFESLVAYCVNFQATEPITEENKQNIFEYEKTEKVTIEDIVYNKIPILDINLFNFNTAAGQNISEGSIIYVLRQNIAIWYYSLRTISIIAMLLVFIYIGIKIAYTSVATEKAEYKEQLKNWIIGFIVIFGIHYFMMAVININNDLVNIVDPTTTSQSSETEGTSNNEIISYNEYKNQNQQQEKSLYEQVRIMAYEVKATTGIPGTIMYVLLVYYLVCFLFLYIKRFFVICILVVVAPLVGINYALKKDKKQKALNIWVKEFSVNVFVQSIHAILYTLLVSIGISMMKTAPIRGTVLAIICIGFIFTAERILKRMIKATSGVRSVKDLAGTTEEAMGIYYATKAATNAFAAGTKKTGGFIVEKVGKNKRVQNVIQNTKKDMKNDFNTVKQYTTEKVPNIKNKAKKVMSTLPFINEKSIEQDNFNKMKNDNINSNLKQQQELENIDIKTYSNINTKIQEVKQEQKRARKEFANKQIDYGKKVIFGKAGVMFRVPILITNPTLGIGLTALKFASVKNVVNKREITKYKTSNKEYTGEKLIFDFATAEIFKEHSSKKDEFVRENIKIGTVYPNKIKKLEEARKIENNIINKIERLNLNESYEKDLIYSNQSTNVIKQEEIKKQDLNRKVYEITQREEFSKAVNVTLQDISHEEIETAVSEYFVENDKPKVETEDLNKITEKINKILEEKGKDIKVTNFFGENVKEELKKELKNVEIDPTEENVKKILPKLSFKELTELLTKAAKEKESINREVPEKYKDIMEDVKQLKQVNEEYKKDTGTVIHQDVATLVKNIKDILEK